MHWLLRPPTWPNPSSPPTSQHPEAALCPGSWHPCLEVFIRPAQGRLCQFHTWLSSDKTPHLPPSHEKAAPGPRGSAEVSAEVTATKQGLNPELWCPPGTRSLPFNLLRAELVSGPWWAGGGGCLYLSKPAQHFQEMHKPSVCTQRPGAGSADCGQQKLPLCRGVGQPWGHPRSAGPCTPCTQTPRPRPKPSPNLCLTAMELPTEELSKDFLRGGQH